MNIVPLVLTNHSDLNTVAVVAIIAAAVAYVVSVLVALARR